ncbi:MAG: CcmD family protein [Nitrospirota bacterium]|nr:CcmD family protein [Nitrospirota bacterium]
MENGVYLFGAYTIAWLGVSFYLYINAKKQKGIEERLTDLEAQLKDKE